MEKISLDEARALLWHEEVQNELKLVTEINNKVAACVMAYFMYSLIYAQEGAKSPRLARQVI